MPYSITSIAMDFAIEGKVNTYLGNFSWWKND